VFLDRFNVLILKIKFKKNKKNIILMHFQMKNTLKNNLYHTSKQTSLSQKRTHRHYDRLFGGQKVVDRSLSLSS
jgi:hypothetical protein